MAFLGTLLNVATVGIGLLNSFVNSGSRAEDIDYAFEFENVGRSFAGNLFNVSSRDDPTPTDGVAVTLLQNADSTTSVEAVNTSTDNDFQLTYANTDGNGTTTAPTPDVLAAAPNPYKSTFLDVTNRFSDFALGNIAVSNAAVAAPAAVLRALQRNNAKGQSGLLAPSTLIGNYGIDNIVAAATYKWPLSDGSGAITWAWNSDASTGELNGVTVTNTSPNAVSVSSTLTWDNPTEAFTLNFTAAGSTSSTPNGAVTTANFPANNRPLSNASIALIKPSATLEEHKSFIKRSVARQVAAGRSRTVKYAFR